MNNIVSNNEERINIIKDNYGRLLKSNPDVSIVIPAYNEEKNILPTLQSLAANHTNWSVEIIVVNNNSSDRTEALVRATGVACINEPVQGITKARNTGLANAKGKFILNADADTIYPEKWIEKMVKPLAENSGVCITYGRFAFIPTGPTPRFTYFFYEYITDAIRYSNKYFKEEAVNVYGFNSGFRKEQGLQVSGFDHPPGSNEDGYLALKLRDKGFGKMCYVTDVKALVWTTDRRIQIDGGLFKAVAKRVKRFFS
jgi:glycosyltransferase involved in cell wall biosynthesis